MPCYHPLRAFQKREGGRLCFQPPSGIAKQLLVGCGQCIGCRLERSRQWAIRCVHEAQMHEHNSFVTLTYDDAHLKSLSLDYRDFQLFCKKLRKRLGKFRFYMAGEYGSKYSRPHFHACLFGVDFVDKSYLRTTGSGSKLFSSKLLADVWNNGYCSVGTVNFESAAYVARYVLDKVYDGNKFHEIINPDTGEVFRRVKEFSRMSLGTSKDKLGGIGKSWLQKFGADVYPHGKVVSNGVEVLPPRYYDNIYKLEDAIGYAAMVDRRRKSADRQWEDQSPKRLLVKEKVKLAQLDMLSRDLGAMDAVSVEAIRRAFLLPGDSFSSNGVNYANFTSRKGENG